MTLEEVAKNVLAADKLKKVKFQLSSGSSHLIITTEVHQSDLGPEQTHELIHELNQAIKPVISKWVRERLKVSHESLCAELFKSDIPTAADPALRELMTRSCQPLP